MTHYTDRAEFLIENLDLPEAAQFEGACWEHFQIAHLNDEATFRVENKSRQIAWSFTAAAEAVADGALNKAGSVFQSINLQEAVEKIRYAKNTIAALPRSLRPVLLTDNRQELEFDNGARLISLPGNPQRGKAQFNVYFDEFAHIQHDEAVYTAALPIIAKGNRRLRVGSSPAGANGRFWEVFTQETRPYPLFARKQTPWWHVHAFCTDVRTALAIAPGLTVAQRVERFGNERIHILFSNMPEEDFGQEFDCLFLSDTLSWITWAEIKAVQDKDLMCQLVECKHSDISAGETAVNWLAQETAVERFFVAGYDVGRVRNTSELYILGINELDMYPVRVAISLDNCDFNSQKEMLRYALDRLNIIGLLIDKNGIGMNLSEDIAGEYPGQAEGYQFTNPSKAYMATNAKKLIQQRRTPLPADRDMAYQFRSIRRKVTPSKNVVYDSEAGKKHHADKFWAWALALVAVGHTFANNEVYNPVTEASRSGEISRW